MTTEPIHAALKEWMTHKPLNARQAIKRLNIIPLIYSPYQYYISLASGSRLIIFCGNTLEVFQAEDIFGFDYAANVQYWYYGLDGILWESDDK